MAQARFAIGTTNIIQYIAEDGLTFQTFDIDAPDAGRTLDGKMHRARVATKTKILVRFRPLFSVKYYDPAGSQVNKTMYKGDESYQARFIYDSTHGDYHDYEVHLIEV